jgi:sulfate/thiosulfate transport system substrate-binding protein
MQGWQSALRQWAQITRLVARRMGLNSAKGWVALFLVGMSLSGTIAACSSNNLSSHGLAAQKPKDIELTLVSFAVTKAAYQAIIPKFADKWQKEHNQTVNFNEGYGGSGTQTRAVIDGLEADVVHLALALDTQRIEKAGLIQPGWEKEVPNNGIVSKSVAALVTREGNPKGINTWADLTREGVSVITADPKTSGVARWNFLALWNAGLKASRNDAKAQEFVSKVYRNVPVLARDAREASDAFFKQGQGDALINYENEILLARKKGAALAYTVPEVNISIDNPIAVVDRNVDQHGNREVAEAFVQYLYSPEAQAEFAKAGFRPVNATVAQTKEVVDQYPKVKTLGTVQDFGGWSAVQKKFFADGAMFDQMQAQTQR